MAQCIGPTAEARGSTRKTLIVALARKLLIALWRMVTTGEAPHGVVLRPAAGAYPTQPPILVHEPTERCWEFGSPFAPALSAR